MSPVYLRVSSSLCMFSKCFQFAFTSKCLLSALVQSPRYNAVWRRRADQQWAPRVPKRHGSDWVTVSSEDEKLHMHKKSQVRGRKPKNVTA